MSYVVVLKIDPDVIIGHDVAGYDFDVFLHRIAQNKLPHWSKLGRLKRANMPKFGSRLGASAPAAGRLVLDTMISARELIRCRSYDLTEVSNCTNHWLILDFLAAVAIH